VLEVTGGEFDSASLVAEQVQLEIPTRPLCREECRGLCPVCGGDRNERPAIAKSNRPTRAGRLWLNLEGLRAPN
jgi:uncharacterized protein